MSALYLLAAEYHQAARQLADLDLDAQTIADTLESIGGELEHKAQNVALMVRSLEADAAAIKQWSDDALERAFSVQSRANSLREYLSRSMQACGIEKITGPSVALSFRTSQAVVIDEPDLVPEEFMRLPEPSSPSLNKLAISTALKAGFEVPGAHLKARKNLQIK